MTIPARPTGYAFPWLAMLILSCLPATALGQPGDRALERLVHESPTSDGLVTMRHLIADLPLYRLDDAGQPVFDASLLFTLLRNTTGQDNWDEGAWLVISKDRTALVVRQTQINQDRITAAMRRLYAQKGIVLVEPNETTIEKTKATPIK